ncbi:QRFP-like peptide receptor, partial [Aplysia californica]|uniref:QRFP-like peptide receptor n=1 Tax=Aplysia californica TaxID=6500 RepID=A0ABM0K6Q7_APLCA
MVYIFLHIRRRLWSSAVVVTTNVRKKRAVVRFLAIAILIFIFCWLPFYTLDIVTDSVKLMMDEEKAEALENGEVYNVTKFCVIILAFSNSLLNPFIYAFFNKNFINEARTICRGSRLRCFSVNRVGPGADS